LCDRTCKYLIAIVDFDNSTLAENPVRPSGNGSHQRNVMIRPHPEMGRDFSYVPGIDCTVQYWDGWFCRPHELARWRKHDAPIEQPFAPGPLQHFGGLFSGSGGKQNVAPARHIRSGAPKVSADTPIS
jgi:hypothetical protein